LESGQVMVCTLVKEADDVNLWCSVGWSQDR